MLQWLLESCLLDQPIGQQLVLFRKQIQQQMSFRQIRRILSNQHTSLHQQKLPVVRSQIQTMMSIKVCLYSLVVLPALLAPDRLNFSVRHVRKKPIKGQSTKTCSEFKKGVGGGGMLLAYDLKSEWKI